eukprot:Pgem_evm1s11393
MTLTTPFCLDGRVALITGAGAKNGIGFAVAHFLGKQGAKVAIAATSARIHDRVNDLIKLDVVDCYGLEGDLSVEKQASDLVEKVVQKYGKIDILVNNAGMVQTGLSLADGDFVSTPSMDWARKLNITLMTTVNTTKAALPYMRSNSYGRIIMMSSVT